jgi:hypothetical protein
LVHRDQKDTKSLLRRSRPSPSRGTGDGGDREPTVTVALSIVLLDALLVRRTPKLWPLVIVPLVTHDPPLMRICGLPPLTETGTLPVMPVMLMLLDVISVFFA